MSDNKHPEQKARDIIDSKLHEAGWVVQDKSAMNLNASIGIAVKEFLTDAGDADYVLFVNRKPVGVIEAKADGLAHNITTV
ncbi:MAG: hypothetical protein ACKO34_08235, partial [Vampirovibrionales bacterium]